MLVVEARWQFTEMLERLEERSRELFKQSADIVDTGIRARANADAARARSAQIWAEARRRKLARWEKLVVDMGETCLKCNGLVGAGPARQPHSDLRISEGASAKYWCFSCDAIWQRTTLGWGRHIGVIRDVEQLMPDGCVQRWSSGD